MGAIRFFLALVVAFDHLFSVVLQPNGWVPNMDWRLGVNAGFALMFFYMISGFLISTALHSKYPASRDGLIRFYQSRFIRIFSLYWPIALLVLLFFRPAQDWLRAAPTVDHLTGIFLFGIDWRASLVSYPLPYLGGAIPGLEPAWALGAELTFYLFAPWLLRSWAFTILALLASAGFRAWVVLHNGFHPVLTYTFLPGTLVFFLIGHLARCASEFIPGIKRHWVASALLGTAATISAQTPLEWDGHAYWTVCLLFAASLPGIFAWTKDNSLMNFLGDLSYPVYLIHNLVIFGLKPFAIALAPTLILSVGATITAIYLLLVVIAAAIAHAAIELPVGFAMRLILSRFMLHGTRRLVE
jgi:peptidoglycan/LPS O-acetylase OafA/YrhL